MGIDVGILLTVLLLFIKGFQKGGIVALGATISIIIGVACALSLSTKVSQYLLEMQWTTTVWAPIISYFLIFIIVVWLTRLLARLIENFTNTILLGWANKLIGGILYGILGVILYSTVIWLLQKAHLLSSQQLLGSKTYPYIVDIAPWVFNHLGMIIPFFKDTFSDLRHFFDTINQQMPEHVGAH